MHILFLCTILMQSVFFAFFLNAYSVFVHDSDAKFAMLMITVVMKISLIVLMVTVMVEVI